MNKEKMLQITKELLTFKGRIHRTRFWIVFLITATIGQILLIGFAGLVNVAAVVSALLAILIGTLVFWIILSNFIRRFHDQNKKGWHVLFGLIPVAGPIYIIILCGVIKGTEGDNEYGKDPLCQS
ncbi:MAG: DUF805 domain-containing protein [Elusimicrobiota bacterium]